MATSLGQTGNRQTTEESSALEQTGTSQGQAQQTTEESSALEQTGTSQGQAQQTTEKSIALGRIGDQPKDDWRPRGTAPTPIVVAGSTLSGVPTEPVQ